MIHDPIVINPPHFDQKAAWGECNELNEVQRGDGGVNWRSAFGADPGIVGCPCCDTNHWNWGIVQRCTKCGWVYPTDWWPMFSWGAQAALRKGREPFRHAERMLHPYYRHGYTHPPGGDLYEAAHKIDWRAVLRKEPVMHDNNGDVTEQDGGSVEPGSGVVV